MTPCSLLKCPNPANPLGAAFPFCSPACRKQDRAAKKKTQTLERIANKRRATKPIYNFYQSRDWAVIRHEVLRLNGGRCVLCGLAARQLGLGVRLEVDHIKPRSTHPELSLDINNLQVLCSVCNKGKLNYDSSDWR